jgi:predicted nucleic acid-binding protein
LRPFFVDANVVVYTATRGPLQAACAELMDAIGDGADGRTSTAVLEEVWHFELSGRGGELTGLTRAVYAVFTPLLPVTDEVVARALDLDVHGIGANDRIHAATCLENGIDTIVTADADFDRVRGLQRVDPLDLGSMRRLLRS